jgi:hypothetical protein
VRWELAPVPGGTRLTLRQTLTDRDWAAKVAAGWHICLAVADRLLDGDPVGPIVGQNARNYGWDDLSEAYPKRLGPARSVAGKSGEIFGDPGGPDPVEPTSTAGSALVGS